MLKEAKAYKIILE
jgi:hypothetical protein